MNYFTGKPCKHGHIAPRNVKGKQCLDCRAALIVAHRARFTPEAWREKERVRCYDHWQRNHDKRLAAAKVGMARLYAQDPQRFIKRTQANEARLARENPTVLALSRAARRAAYRVRQQGGISKRGLTKVVRRVWNASGGKCAVCASTDRPELDHVVALINGGTNAETNLQFLCMPCNRAKGARDYQTWLDSRAQPMGIAA